MRYASTSAPKPRKLPMRRAVASAPQANFSPPAPRAVATAITEREAFKIERLYYESLPRLYATGNLYVPKKRSGRAPAVVYLYGHSPAQRFRFQPHTRRWTEQAFVAVVVDTIQLGELAGYYYGPYAKGRFHRYCRGYMPA